MHDEDMPMIPAARNAAPCVKTPSAHAADLSASVIARACETINPHAVLLRQLAEAACSSGDRTEQMFFRIQLREMWHAGNLVTECMLIMFPDEMPVELATPLLELNSALEAVRNLL